MAKPSFLPRWADVLGKIVVPSSGKQDVGFVAEEKPPEGFLNWLFNGAYQWLSYLDAIESEALSWIAAQTFRRLILAPTAAPATLVAKSYQTSLAQFLIDSNGFPMGRYYSRDLTWDTGGGSGTLDITATSDPLVVGGVGVPWRFSTTGTSPRVRFTKPGDLTGTMSQIGCCTVSMNVPGGGRSTLSHRANEISHEWMALDFSAFVMEFEVAFITAFNNCNVRIGLLDRSRLPAPTTAQWDGINAPHIAISRNAGETNWFLQFSDASALNPVDRVSLGVGPTLNTWQTIRLEYYPGTTFSTARVYVDGMLRHATANAIRMPHAGGTADLGYPVVTIEESGGASSAQLYLSPFRVRHTMFRSSYELSS